MTAHPTTNSALQTTAERDHAPTLPDTGEAAGVDNLREALVALGRRATALPDTSVLLLDAAEMAAEGVEADCFAIGRRDPDTTWIHLSYGQLGGSDDCSDLQQTRLEATGTKSFCGYAMSVGRSVVVEDLEKERRFTDVFLAKQGIRSGIVCPLVHSNRAFGALGVFGVEPRKYTKDESLLVESITHLVNSAVARDRAEQRLAHVSTLNETVQNSLRSLVLVLSPDGNIAEINQATHNVTGFALAEMKDRPMWSALLLPADVAALREALKQLTDTQQTVTVETSLLTKHGEQRRVQWALTAIPGENPRRVAATGLDVTEHHRAIEKLKKAETEAAEARRSLAELKERIEKGDLVTARRSSGSSDIENERRQRARRAFPYIQLIAPVREGEQLDRRTFQEVRCKDISSSGFGYLLAEMPDYKELIVAFGLRAPYTYLRATIRHVTPIDHDGKKMYMVGCRYTGRHME